MTEEHTEQRTDPNSAPKHSSPEDPTPDRSAGDVGHPSAQIPISDDLVQKLGDAADDYVMALWSTAQQTDADADEMASMIRQVNDEFGVVHPDEIVNKWQEIFRNSGGLVTVICEDRVLAGALSEANAMEQPHASDGPAIDQQTDTESS